MTDYYKDKQQMTLQQIADYAMEYLHDKSIPADYDIFDDHVIVYFEGLSCAFVCNATKVSIKGWIDSLNKNLSRLI
ncbi:hypothetical protein [Pseudoalteromonas sp.]|uniref:hypothetical protein n=1 Tax=Pseudoalteromonas sp. TaxID=53249 RepID=UPI003564C9AB